MGEWIQYTKNQKIASDRYSNIKSRVKNLKKNSYDLEKYWHRNKFIEWYIAKEKKCCYCGCDQSELEFFYNLTSSKRNNKRGKSLEIERFKDEPYSEKNCDLVCYWCNNAKSDIFTFEQFKPIGISIGLKIKEIVSQTIFL